MKTYLLQSLLILLLSSGSSAWAQIYVEAVQPPAWKQQGKTLLPIFPGESLAEGTTIINGSNARVTLQLPEGSQLELGQNVETTLPKARTQNRIFEGTINMLQGAFRFTTDKFAKNRQRNVSINLPSSTIGIRGTDVWGKSDSRSDFVVLIEGDIAIDHNSGTTVRLNQATTVYEAPTGGQPLPVRSIDTPELLQLAAQTSLIPKKAVLTRATDYTLIVGSYLERIHAERAVTFLHSKGYPAQIEPVRVNNERFNRVVFEGFYDLDHARSFSDELYDASYITHSWIAQN